MKDNQQRFIGLQDPHWLAFLASIGQPNTPRARRQKRDAAIQAIRQLRDRNQQRLQAE